MEEPCNELGHIGIQFLGQSSDPAACQQINIRMQQFEDTGNIFLLPLSQNLIQFPIESFLVLLRFFISLLML